MANGINIRKYLLLTSRYSSLMPFQNAKSEYENNWIFSEESEEMSINCSSSVVVKFDGGFPVSI